MGCEALVVAEVEDDGRDWDVRMLSRPAERGRKGKQDQLDRPKADDSSLACGLKGPSLTYFLLQHLYSRSRLPRLVEGTLVVPLRADERRQEQEGWREEVTGQLDSNVVAVESSMAYLHTSGTWIGTSAFLRADARSKRVISSE